MGDASSLFLDQSGALGGAELFLLDYLRRREGKSQVALFAEGPFLESLAAAGIPVEHLCLDTSVTKASGLLAQIGATLPLYRAAKQSAKLAQSHDAIYANTQKAAIVGAAASWLSGKPLIWHLHDLVTAEHFSRANRLAVIGATNWIARRIIANSEATAEAYREAGGRVQVEVVYNGIDEEPFDAIRTLSTSEAREASGLSFDGPLIGVFGRLAEWKGQHVLLKALAANVSPAVQAVVVGEALYTDEDRDYAVELRERSSQICLKGRIDFLGQRSDIAMLMRACDIVVHTSVQPEPFGRVIVEGMLAGRPVIASAAGGATEIIEDGVNGLLTPPGDAKALGAAIDRLLNNPELSGRLAEAGRASAIKRFFLDDRVDEINEVIEEVVAEHRSQSRKARSSRP